MQVDDVTDKLSELSDSAQASFEGGKEGLAQADAWLREKVKENPAAVLGGFAVLGYLLGRLVARR